MEHHEILSKLYDISANMDCGDVFEAGSQLDALIRELEADG